MRCKQTSDGEKAALLWLQPGACIGACFLCYLSIYDSAQQGSAVSLPLHSPDHAAVLSVHSDAAAGAGSVFTGLWKDASLDKAAAPAVAASQRAVCRYGLGEWQLSTRQPQHRSSTLESAC